MGRPREFNETEVLRRATTLFGHRGFDAVSVDALLGELALNRGSFYKIFGSKHGLARAALEQVCQRAQAGDLDEDSKDLVVVSLVELAPANEELRALTSRAVDLCFGNDTTLMGQHLLLRAHRTTEQGSAS